MLKLVVQTGEQAGREFVLQDGENIVGRGRQSTLRVTSPFVSRQHLRVTVRDGQALPRT